MLTSRTIGFFIVFTVWGCFSLRKDAQMAQTMPTNEWHSLKPGVSALHVVRSVLGAPSKEVQSATYGPQENLHLLSYDQPQASVFLKSGKVLVIVIIPKEGGEFPLLLDDWQK